MINLTTVSTPRATRPCVHVVMPASSFLGTSVSIEGWTVVGSYITAARVPAFLKDTTGVRAWSPPV